MLPILAVSLLALFSSGVRTHPGRSFISALATRHANTTGACDMTCDSFQTLYRQCNTPHCGCNIQYIQAQGDCLLCQCETPEEAAAVQLFLDEEMDQCHSEGIKVDFQLQLPPIAARIIYGADILSAELRRKQAAFLFLQIAGGQVGLVILLVFDVFSPNIHRNATFFNFCLTWIFSSIVYSLLLYKGTAGHTSVNLLGEVPEGECLAQAALTNSVQVMTACSTMALVIELWLGLRTSIYGGSTRGTMQNRWTSIVLLGAPYILFLAFALTGVLLGHQLIETEYASFQSAVPTNFYCTVFLNPFVQATYGVALGCLVITVIFDALIFKILYLHWAAFRGVQTKSIVSLSMLMRVMIFSAYRVVVAVAYTIVFVDVSNVQVMTVGNFSSSLKFVVPIWVDMLQASIPLAACLVFGVSRDHPIAALILWCKSLGWFRRPTCLQSIQDS